MHFEPKGGPWLSAPLNAPMVVVALTSRVDRKYLRTRARDRSKEAFANVEEFELAHLTYFQLCQFVK